MMRRAAAPCRRPAAFKAVFEALADADVDAEPVVYEDIVCDVVREKLAAASTAYLSG